jgi:hypothetical protein
MSVMTTIASSTRRYPGAPTLRLHAGRSSAPWQSRRPRFATSQIRRASELSVIGGSARAGAVASRSQADASQADAPVLVAGSDATRRDAMIDELAQTMAPGTRFTHAAASWEVLALAGTSRMVIVSGGLEDLGSASLMRMLSHRYPALPVVSLDADRSLTAA